MSKNFEFVRLVGNERRVGPTLASVSRHWVQKQEKFLFISPHDDDIVFGAGLTILAALRSKVPVHVAIVTDGAMGYCSLQEKETVSAIRRRETFAAYKALGVPAANIHWLGFPDCQLAYFQGRRPARPGDPAQSHGYTGLQHSFTELLRRLRPKQIFLPTSADLHPDHRLVHQEMLISCFHAAGKIWPELGPPLPPPYLHECAIYCNFPAPPTLRIHAPDATMRTKLRAMAHFGSQKQAGSIMNIIERSGPFEYLRAIEFSLYNPLPSRELFDEPPKLNFLK